MCGSVAEQAVRRPPRTQVLVRPPMAAGSARSFDPGSTPASDLAPWEVAKAYAFSVVLDKLHAVTGLSMKRLVNNIKAGFIASQVRTASGNHPGARAVQHVVARCQDTEWWPGKPRAQSGGRPPVYNEFRKKTRSPRLPWTR